MIKLFLNYRLFWVVFVFCFVLAACSSNAFPMPTNPIGTPMLLPSPTYTIVPTFIPTFTPNVSLLSGVCKSTNYCQLGDCRKDQCLFVSPSSPNNPVGFAILKGYYVQLQREGMGNDMRICDDFVIVDGSPLLIHSYLSLIESGNGIMSRNESGQPIINLDLEQVDESDKQKVLTSAKDKEIDLHIVNLAPRPMGAPTCYSPVEIVGVK